MSMTAQNANPKQADFQAAFEAMRRRSGDFIKRWRAWATTKSPAILCDRHGYTRERDDEASTRESWARRDFVAVFKSCPQCAAEDAIRRKSDGLRQMGVSDENVLHATFDNFICRSDADRENLAKAREFSIAGRGFLVILGTFGNGKTHLAVAIMRTMDCPSRFITQASFLRSLRDTYRNDRSEDIVRVCSRVKLLVLDEVGLSGGGKDELPALHEVLSYRHETRKPTVITSNLASKEEFANAIGERMADRLRQSAFGLLMFEGESMRRRFRSEYHEKGK